MTSNSTALVSQNPVGDTIKQASGLIEIVAARYDVEPAVFRDVIFRTIFDSKGTEAEFMAFLAVCNAYKLNPLTREIYAFPKKGGGIVPIVSIDGWIRLVNTHPEFKGFECYPEKDDKGEMYAFTCKMHRKDRDMPTVVTEYFVECKRDTDPWKMKMRMMHHKTFMQCARYTFGFSGIYDEDDAAPLIDHVARTAGSPERAGMASRPPKAPSLDVTYSEVPVDPVSGEVLQDDQQDGGPVTGADAAPAEATKAEPEPEKAAPKPRTRAKAKEAEPEKEPEKEPDYAPEPIIAAITEALDDCSTKEEIEKVRVGVILPALETLRPAEAEEAKKLYNIAQARVAAFAKDAETAAEERAEGGQADAGYQVDDDRFPGDIPSNLPPIDDSAAGDGADQAGAVDEGAVGQQDGGAATGVDAIKTREEYEDHVRAYTDAATSIVVLKDQWYSEGDTRARLWPDSGKVKPVEIKKYVFDRIDVMRANEAK